MLGTPRLSCSSKVIGKKMDFCLKETLLFLRVTFTSKALAPVGSSHILQHGRLPYPWIGAFHYYPLNTREFFLHTNSLWVLFATFYSLE